MRDGVSFVVPVYNKAPWLPRVLDALFAQAPEEDRQFVFVDDGSTDGSMDLVEAALAARPAIAPADVVLIRQDNRGSAAATNRGIAAAGRAFIKFCDADDLLHAQATTTLLAALRADPAAVLCWGDCVRYAEGDPIDLTTPLAAGPSVRRLDDPLPPALRNSLFNPTQFVARTAAVVASGGCDERVVHSQEYSLTLRLARLGPFLHLPAPVCYLPQEAPGRLSGTDPGRQLQRVTRAVAYFLHDHPEVPEPLRRTACKRAAGRAWKYRHRHRGDGPLSPWFWRHLLASLHPPADPAFIERCAQAFEPDAAEPDAAAPCPPRREETP